MLPRYPKPFFLNVFSFAIVVGVAISGCTSLPAAPTPDEAEFTVQGRLGVRDAGESFSSSFSWAHGTDGYHIELWGPLGQGRTRLVGQEGAVTVYAANGDVHVEQDSAMAMYRWLGFSVPIDALTRWIRGQAALEFTIESMVQDARGDLESLTQLGWGLEFSDYRDLEQGHRVPGRIIAHRDAVRVTLVPRQWVFSPTFQ